MNQNPAIVAALLQQLGPCPGPPPAPTHTIGDVRQVCALGGYGIGVLPCRVCGQPLMPVPLRTKVRGLVDRLAIWVATH